MNTTLALTISPPLRFGSGTKLRNPNKYLYQEDMRQLKAIFKYIRCGTYIVWPEFDEKGRLHYHGTISFDVNQWVRFHKYAIHKLRLIGFCDTKILKTFTDKLRWLLYCRKTWNTSSMILEIDKPFLKNV